ncbi:hypothetical protein LZ518_09170 [Sphingomonas sp. RB56-2]|uniref:Uncharacterized protein n=1 Tax=Sphingomonas brevis TaxID=2908206 RepID=A0ABT0SAC9_9SPHN|nr:hypothetical protein [Sphingomonas brevis]MCL6741297.1 hypothetical protein [Sphingomonas brevis]
MSRKRSVGAAADLEQVDAVSLAHSLQEDFAKLIAMFDHQLEKGSSPDGDAQSRIADALTAARRGFSITEELSELLRANQ